MTVAALASRLVSAGRFHLRLDRREDRGVVVDDVGHPVPAWSTARRRRPGTRGPVHVVAAGGSPAGASGGMSSGGIAGGGGTWS